MKCAKQTFVVICVFLLVFVWLGPESKEVFILLGILESMAQRQHLPPGFL